MKIAFLGTAVALVCALIVSAPGANATTLPQLTSNENRLLDYIQSYVADGNLKKLFDLDFPMSASELKNLASGFNIDDAGNLQKNDYPDIVVAALVRFLTRTGSSAPTLGQVDDATAKSAEKFENMLLEMTKSFAEDSPAALDSHFRSKINIVANSAPLGSKVLQTIADSIDRVIGIYFPQNKISTFVPQTFRKQMVMTGRPKFKWSETYHGGFKVAAFLGRVPDAEVALSYRVDLLNTTITNYLTTGYENVVQIAVDSVISKASDVKKAVEALKHFARLIREECKPETDLDRTYYQDVIKRYDDFTSEIVDANHIVQHVIADGLLASSFSLEFPLTDDEVYRIGQVSKTYLQAFGTDTSACNINLAMRLTARGPQWTEAVNRRADKFKAFLISLGDMDVVPQQLVGDIINVSAKNLFGGRMLHHIAKVIKRTIRYRQLSWLGPLRKLNPLMWHRKWKNHMRIDMVNVDNMQKLLMDVGVAGKKRAAKFGEFVFGVYAAGYDEVVSKAVNDFLKENGIGEKGRKKRFSAMKKLAILFRSFPLEDNSANQKKLLSMLGNLSVTIPLQTTV